MRVDIDRIRIARISKGLLVRELADSAGISRAAAVRACGTGECGLIVARSIAKVLDLKLSDIVVDYGLKIIEGEPAR